MSTSYILLEKPPKSHEITLDLLTIQSKAANYKDLVKSVLETNERNGETMKNIGNIKYLVIIRHGEQEKRFEGLTLIGRQQAGFVAKLLGQKFTVDTVSILTSPTDRARQTAIPISEVFHTPVVDADELYNDHNHAAIVRLLEFQESELVILITHMPIVNELPSKIGCDMNIKILSGHCEGVIITFGNNRLTLEDLTWKDGRDSHSR